MACRHVPVPPADPSSVEKRDDRGRRLRRHSDDGRHHGGDERQGALCSGRWWSGRGGDRDAYARSSPRHRATRRGRPADPARPRQRQGRRPGDPRPRGAPCPTLRDPERFNAWLHPPARPACVDEARSPEAGGSMSRSARSKCPAPRTPRSTHRGVATSWARGFGRLDPEQRDDHRPPPLSRPADARGRRRRGHPARDREVAAEPGRSGSCGPRSRRRRPLEPSPWAVECRDDRGRPSATSRPGSSVRPATAGPSTPEEVLGGVTAGRASGRAWASLERWPPMDHVRPVGGAGAWPGLSRRRRRARRSRWSPPSWLAGRPRGLPSPFGLAGERAHRNQRTPTRSWWPGRTS